MKKLVLFLLPVIALAAAGGDGGTSKEEKPGVLWQESVANEQAGEPVKALEATVRYLREGGDPYLANLRAGWIHYGQKQHVESARFYQAAARLQPGALSPRLGLLNIATDKGDPVEAVKAGELVLAVDKCNLRALYAVAWGAFQAKAYARSGVAYRRILELYPEETDAASGAAWSAFYEGRKVEARRFFRMVVGVNPEYPDARKGLELCK
jgi:tetratricopeptide (TPR) repeat protein